MKDDDFHRRFLAPLIIAALNTEPEQASAPLAAQILRDTFARGAVRPYLPRNGLSASLIDPALVYLEARGGEIAYGLRLRRLERRNDQVTGLHFAETVVPLRAGDRVILATPATVAGELVEGLTVPDDFRPIVNVHFAGEVASPDPFIGLVGGLAEWVFFKPGHVSITVSAATRAVEETPERIAARCWDDLLKGGLVRGALPLYRVVKEKRATFAATPVQLARRPAAATPLANLFLAGDYTATGWPATMESAVRSGQEAARRALQN
jgi:phytoene dehydrogenase-like protein